MQLLKEIIHMCSPETYQATHNWHLCEYEGKPPHALYISPVVAYLQYFSNTILF